MSAFDFAKARELSAHRFAALIMGAIIAGNERQVVRLRAAFPEIAQEFDARRKSPDGRTPAEAAFDALELPAGTRRR